MVTVSTEVTGDGDYVRDGYRDESENLQIGCIWCEKTGDTL